jgi:hypothetical protein
MIPHTCINTLTGKEMCRACLSVAEWVVSMAGPPLVPSTPTDLNKYVDENPPTQDSPAIATARLVFSILSEALEAGGFSSGRIVERLREEGIEGLTVSHLHSCGLQDIANAITGASMVDELERRAETAEALARRWWTGVVPIGENRTLDEQAQALFGLRGGGE